MTWQQLIVSAIVATALQSATVAAAQGLGYTRMNLPLLLGTLVTADRSRAMTYGYALHMAVGLIFTSIYAEMFGILGKATWWLGSVMGLVHGLVVMLIVLPLIPYWHHRVATERQGPTPTRLLQPPGFLGLHYGRGTPLVTLLSHVVYGAALGILL
jgi:xanthine/uracil permease